MKPAALPTDHDLSPAVEELLDGFNTSRGAPLSGRERRAESLITVLFVAIAVTMVVTLGGGEAPAFGTAVVLVAGYALALRVCFPVGASYSAPTQLFLVPMLLLVPPAWTPLLVGVAGGLAALPDYVGGTKHPDRALLKAGDSLYTVPAALLLAVAGSGAPDWSDSSLYLAALLLLLASDFVVTVARERLAFGVETKLQIGLQGWVWLVDILLAPIGLVLAFAAAGRPAVVLLGLPLVGLLALFAVERRQRVEHALELSRAYRGTTLLLNDVLDADDEYTASHSRDVVSLSVAVALEMGLDDRRCQLVEFGALLHDIGKIAVPNEIINKDGPLTDDEWVVIKAHTVEGQRMLDKVGGVMGEVGRIVRSSHEDWQGTGYPDRLAREEIPLESTIVSCCDAFNAMTTDRSYRRAMPVEVALQELKDHAGTQFNPAVVEVLIEIMERTAPAPAIPATGPAG